MPRTRWAAGRTTTCSTPIGGLFMEHRRARGLPATDMLFDGI